jgi:hypothetical protein
LKQDNIGNLYVMAVGMGKIASLLRENTPKIPSIAGNW